MATVSRGLPGRPHLDVPKREARALLKDFRDGAPEALDRVARRHPRFKDEKLTDANKGNEGAAPKETAPKFLLNDGQLVIAREYGFSNWAELQERIEGNTIARLLQEAIHNDDRESV